MKETLLLPTAVEGFTKPPPQNMQKAVCSANECQVSFRQRLAKANKEVASTKADTCSQADTPQSENAVANDKVVEPAETASGADHSKMDKASSESIILPEVVIPAAICLELNPQNSLAFSEAELVNTDPAKVVESQGVVQVSQMTEAAAGLAEVVNQSLENNTISFQVEQPQPAQGKSTEIENIQPKQNEAHAAKQVVLENSAFVNETEINPQQTAEQVVEKVKVDNSTWNNRTEKAEVSVETQPERTVQNTKNNPQNSSGSAQNQRSDTAQLGESSLQVENTSEKVKATSVQSGKIEAKSEDPPLQQATAAVKPAEGTAKPIEPARLAEAHRPELVSQIARGLENFAKTGQHSVRLQLYPENLGRIDLRLISNTEGVQIVMNAEQPATSFMLERHLSTLKETLAQAGVNLTGLFVGDGRNQNRPDFAQRSFVPAGQYLKNTPLAAQTQTETPQASRILDSSSNFDYRI